MLAFKSCYSVEEIELQNIDAETARASVNTGVNEMVFGVFYRPPGHNPSPVEQLENAITQVMTKFKNNPNITYILGGDFNTGDIDWETGTIYYPTPLVRRPMRKSLDSPNSLISARYKKNPPRKSASLTSCSPINPTL